jgi:hypothetical protein
MPVRTAQLGDTVQYRDAKGRTRNATVRGTQPAVIGAGAWSVANSGTGGTLTAATYGYRITQVINGVESAPATGKTTVVGAGTTNKCTITLPGTAGVIYKIYGRTGGSELLIGTTAAGASTFDDTGSVTPTGALPTADGRVNLTPGRKGGDAVGLGIPAASSGTVLKATTLKGTNVYYSRT